MFEFLPFQKPPVKPLNGQSNEIFDPKFFFHSNRPGPLTNGLKYRLVFGLDFAEIFEFFRSSAQYHTALSQIPRSIILR